MKPEDRKRLKQHIEMVVEHKMPAEETVISEGSEPSNYFQLFGSKNENILSEL